MLNNGHHTLLQRLNNSLTLILNSNKRRPKIAKTPPNRIHFSSSLDCPYKVTERLNYSYRLMIAEFTLKEKLSVKVTHCGI